MRMSSGSPDNEILRYLASYLMDYVDGESPTYEGFLETLENFYATLR